MSLRDESTTPLPISKSASGLAFIPLQMALAHALTQRYNHRGDAAMIWHLSIWVAAMGAFIGVMLLWDFAVLLVFGLFGMKVPLPLHFRRRQETNAALQRLGKFRYVLISGVLLFGLPIGFGLETYDYIVDKYLTRSFHGVILGHLWWTLVAATIVGVAYGVWTWKKSILADNPARS
ncbi:MAG TPA: hypothetical protein VKD23_17745 [Terriglobales bacterium]|nr:hypothetical protein [Terriglobales bacterium]